jgi:hypothetical protein
LPVQVVNDRGPRVRLKFLRNTCYDGVDYGPGLEAGDQCEVDSRWAPAFLANGRAVEVVDEKAPTAELFQVRDPEPENRDPHPYRDQELKKKR